MRWTARLRAHLSRVVLTGLLAGLAGSAGALTLTPATFYEFVSVGGNSAGGFPVDTVPGTETVNEPAGYPRGTGTATATTSNILPLLTETSLVLSAFDSPAAYGGSAEARINFQFAIEALPGGTAGAMIPVDITTSGLVSLDLTAGTAGGASGTAFAILGLPGIFTLTANRACSGSVAGGVSCTSADGESFGGTFTRTLQEGTLYSGELHVGLHGQGGGLGFTTNAYAMVDPSFVIQAPFAGDYQVVFSPNLSAVPLPAALPLLAGASAVLGLRRRRPQPGRGRARAAGAVRIVATGACGGRASP